MFSLPVKTRPFLPLEAKQCFLTVQSTSQQHSVWNAPRIWHERAVQLSWLWDPYSLKNVFPFFFQEATTECYRISQGDSSGVHWLQDRAVLIVLTAIMETTSIWDKKSAPNWVIVHQGGYYRAVETGATLTRKSTQCSTYTSAVESNENVREDIKVKMSLGMSCTWRHHFGAEVANIGLCTRNNHSIHLTNRTTQLLKSREFAKISRRERAVSHKSWSKSKKNQKKTCRLRLIPTEPQTGRKANC